LRRWNGRIGCHYGVVHFLFCLVITICNDLFDSLSPLPLTKTIGFALLLLPGADGVAFLVSVTYFAAMEWKDWLSLRSCSLFVLFGEYYMH
jgi:hypothetical protein